MGDSNGSGRPTLISSVGQSMCINKRSAGGRHSDGESEERGERGATEDAGQTAVDFGDGQLSSWKAKRRTKEETEEGRVVAKRNLLLLSLKEVDVNHSINAINHLTMSSPTNNNWR